MQPCCDINNVMLLKIAKFFSGLSLADYLRLAAFVAFVALVTSWQLRGNEIARLREQVADERLAHEITLTSLSSVRGELDTQNVEIQKWRAASDQARLDLRAAVEASFGTDDLLTALKRSAGSPYFGSCEPSETVRNLWPAAR